MSRHAEDDLHYHSARILLLVEVFSRGRAGKIDGLTKIAKLDFLLRYPVFLERLLVKKELDWPPGAEPTLAERRSVESRMVRYKFGPWDNEYYTVIGNLLGKGLVRPVDGKGQVCLAVTDEGREVAASLKSRGWKVEATRGELLRNSFDESGSKLMRMIYEEFKQELDIPWGTTIQ